MEENLANPANRLFPIPRITKTMWFTFIVFATTPFWIQEVGLYQYIALEILIWCIYTMSYNMALGYTGLPSFGHGAYLGVGAYGMAIYQASFDGNNLWVGLLIAAVSSFLAAGIVGLFIAHRRGIYFALMTIAFGQIFWTTAIKWHTVTGGEDGILNLKRLPVDLGFISFNIDENHHMFYFVWVIFVLVIIGLWGLIHSPFGKVIQAVKQNEMRSLFIGYDIRLYKWASFTLSGSLAGIAGGLFAMAQQSAYPDLMSLHQSGLVVLMVVVGGGFVSFWGPVVGTILYFLARDILGALTPTWVLWYGLMFMLLVMFKPEGLAGIWQNLMKTSKNQDGVSQKNFMNLLKLFKGQDGTV